jgi:uncharacterized iron-regulated protein
MPTGTPAPSIWSAHEQRFVGDREVAADLVAARYRMLGERHDNPAHHAIRARLVREIAASGARPAVVFEQFDLANDEALRVAQASGADAERLASAGRLDRKSWDWPLHEPIVTAALEMRLPVRAGNVARAQLRGGDAAARDRNAVGEARLRAARWTDAQTAILTDDIVEGHCGKLPEGVVPRIVLAQRVRDAAMAQALVDAATADGAVLIAGNGHVRNDVGVPVYVRAPGLPDADARSISVGFVEVRDDAARDRDALRRIAADHPGFDYLWFTAPVARDDPCASLPAKPASP